MVLISQIVKFASILLYVIVVNLAHAGNDKGYLNLNMKDHNLNIKSYDDRDIISAIMNKVGTYDSKHKCYVSNINEYRFCLNLVSFNMVDGGLVYNLGLSGYELNGKYNTGLFLALEYSIFEVGNGLRFRSINGFYGVGTADAPLKKSQVKLIEIADRKYAWELKDYNFGYGVLSEKTTLINQTSYNDFMPQKKIIVFDSLNDNSGKCGAAFNITCEEKRVEYKFLENNSKQNSVKDIELKFIQKEDNIIKKTHTEIINYDTKNYQYNLPSDDMISYMEKKVSLIPSNTNNNYQSGLKNFQKSEYECVNKANEKIILKIDYKNKSVNWANKISVDVVYDAASEGLIAYYDNRNTNLIIKGDIVYYTENNKKSVLNCSELSNYDIKSKNNQNDNKIKEFLCTYQTTIKPSFITNSKSTIVDLSKKVNFKIDHNTKKITWDNRETSDVVFEENLNIYVGYFENKTIDITYRNNNVYYTEPNKIQTLYNCIVDKKVINNELEKVNTSETMQSTRSISQLQTAPQTAVNNQILETEKRRKDNEQEEKNNIKNLNIYKFSGPKLLKDNKLYRDCTEITDVTIYLYDISRKISPDFYENNKTIYCTNGITRATIMGQTIDAESTKFWTNESALLNCINNDICRGNNVSIISTNIDGCYKIISSVNGYINKERWINISKNDDILEKSCNY